MDTSDAAALEEFVNRLIDKRLQSIDRGATVKVVNVDGSVTLDLGDGTVATSQPSLASYTPRTVGDVVLVRNRGGEMLIQGKVGAAVPIPTVPTALTATTVSNSAAPTGWDAISSVWAQAGSPANLWLQRTTAVTPPAGGNITHTATGHISYRNGGITSSAFATQGDYTGNGMNTGIFTFGAGAWSGLTSHTCTRVTVTLHRVAAAHGSWGPVQVYLMRHNVTDPPVSTPALIGGTLSAGRPSLNQTVVSGTTDPIWTSFGQGFLAGTVQGLAIYSTNAGDYAQIDSATLSIDYT